MAKLKKIIETSLYCNNLKNLISFYKEVMQLEPMVEDERFCAFNVNDESVLLLFLRGGSLEPQKLPGGMIPAHDGQAPTHMAFAIDPSELAGWRERLLEFNVTVLSSVEWPLGGTSIYFHDPEKNLIELATPGVWTIY